MRPGTIIGGAYLAVLMAALVLGPVFLLHGYRQWWVVTFFGGGVLVSIVGCIGHSRTPVPPDHHRGSLLAR